jgi:hypothetical protein
MHSERLLPSSHLRNTACITRYFIFFAYVRRSNKVFRVIYDTLTATMSVSVPTKTRFWYNVGVAKRER